MTDKSLLIDLDKCVGCFACEIACKEEHNLPVGPRWIRVYQVGPRTIGDDMHLDMGPVMCLHCVDPPCLHVCQAGAIGRREDGLVVIDPHECIGCEWCVHACPYGAISLHPDLGLAGKCTLCVERTDHGLEPTCVQHCMGGALMWVTPEEEAHITAGMHLAGTGKVKYASSKWALSY